MSGHEFEKQVRQKLNDLKMTPSAGAWENIEESLREKRRRVAPVLWLSLLLIGLTAGGFLFINSFDGKDQQVAVHQDASSPKEKTGTSASPRDNTSSGAPQGQTIPSDGPLETNSSAATELTRQTPASNAPRAGSKASTETARQVNTKSLASAAPKANIKTLVSSAPQVNTKSPASPAPKAENKTLMSSAPLATSKTANNLTAYSKFPSLNISNERAKINAPSLLINTTATATPSIQKKKSSKWSWGLSGVAGVSSVSEGDFFNLNFNKAQVEDVATVALFAPQPPFEPSSISSGLTYSLGGFVKRELSKKFSLSTGINYLQLNTRNKVGSRINARQVVNNGTRGYIFVTSYYTLQQDQPSEYRNRYHFVEVPVELHTRVNKSEKVTMHINTGFAVSRLIKSNSLHFDGSTGVYYKNDRLLNRTQLATKIGFSFGLLNNTSRPVWIGPYARYNISRILQKDVSASKSFASFGLDMKLFIK